MSNINNWRNMIKVEGRSFPDLIQKLDKEITMPCKIMQWGHYNSGQPWVVICLDRPSKENKPTNDGPPKEVK